MGDDLADPALLKDWLETYLSALKGSEKSCPFGPEALVFKVGGKMFALVSQLETIPRVTLKCVPADGALLVSQFDSVVPGYYMNKKHWITVSLNGELVDEIIMDLADTSHQLVVNGLSRAAREKVSGLP